MMEGEAGVLQHAGADLLDVVVHHLQVPPRLLWLQKLLLMQSLLPTPSEQAADVGKAVLRYAFGPLAAGDREREGLDRLGATAAATINADAVEAIKLFVM